MEIVLNEDRDKAVAELELLYKRVEVDLLSINFVYYKTNRTDLDDYKLFRDAVEQSSYGKVTIIPVWSGCSSPEVTIYSSEEDNYRLRFWHDAIHYMLNLDFSYESEEAVVLNHMSVAVDYELSYLARKILFAELAGQVRYHKNKGEFPHNQAAFIDSCLRYGVNTAARYKH